MELLFVTPFFTPRAGGSAVVPYMIGKELARRGHNVTVLTTEYGRSDVTFEDEQSMEIVTVRLKCELAGLLYSPEIVEQLSRLSKGVQLIHMHNFRTYQNIMAHKAAREHNIPYVLQAHGSIPRIGKTWIKEVYDYFYGRSILKDASMVMAVTEFEARQYEAFSVPPTRVAIIPNGIDLKYYDPLPPRGAFRNRFGINEHTKIILYLGRIHWIKGIDNLLKAYSRLVKGSDSKDFLLVIAGPDDGYLARVVSLISSLNLEQRVILNGGIYGNEKLEALVDADVFVLPSRLEIWGMAALEATACGTPVVLTSSCGISPYLKDKVAVVTNQSVEELANALRLLLHDPNLAQKFRNNTRAVVEQFEITKVVQTVEEVYLRALGRN